MTIQFVREYVTSDGKRYQAGQVLNLPDPLAADLIRQGVAKQRIPPGPTETKSRAAALDDPEAEEGETVE